jgi:hypothetical protein
MNSKELYGKGYTYKITRRTIQHKNETVIRVRVRAWAGPLCEGTPEMNEYRDYEGKDMAMGDELFFRQIKVIQEQFNG